MDDAACQQREARQVQQGRGGPGQLCQQQQDDPQRRIFRAVALLARIRASRAGSPASPSDTRPDRRSAMTRSERLMNSAVRAAA
jgi:hypothetical protein